MSPSAEPVAVAAVPGGSSPHPPKVSNLEPKGKKSKSKSRDGKKKKKKRSKDKKKKKSKSRNKSNGKKPSAESLTDAKAKPVAPPNLRDKTKQEPAINPMEIKVQCENQDIPPAPVNKYGNKGILDPKSPNYKEIAHFANLASVEGEEEQTPAKESAPEIVSTYVVLPNCPSLPNPAEPKNAPPPKPKKEKKPIKNNDNNGQVFVMNSLLQEEFPFWYSLDNQGNFEMYREKNEDNRFTVGPEVISELMMKKRQLANVSAPAWTKNCNPLAKLSSLQKKDAAAFTDEIIQRNSFHSMVGVDEKGEVHLEVVSIVPVQEKDKKMQQAAAPPMEEDDDDEDDEPPREGQLRIVEPTTTVLYDREDRHKRQQIKFAHGEKLKEIAERFPRRGEKK